MVAGLIGLQLTAVAQSEASSGPGDTPSVSESAKAETMTPARPVVAACLATPGQPGVMVAPQVAGAASGATAADAASAEASTGVGRGAGGTCLAANSVPLSGGAAAAESSTSNVEKVAAASAAPTMTPVSAAEHAKPEAAPSRPVESAEVASKVAANSAEKPHKSARPPVGIVKAWWPQPTPNRLNLRFAGEASFGQAVVLLFDAPFSDTANADANIAVQDARGKPVMGHWLVATGNPHMLVFKAESGKYQVKIGAGLKTQAGLVVGASSSGPVYLR
jgi:hypothetical protein